MMNDKPQNGEDGLGSHARKEDSKALFSQMFCHNRAMRSDSFQELQVRKAKELRTMVGTKGRALFQPIHIASRRIETFCQ